MAHELRSEYPVTFQILQHGVQMTELDNFIVMLDRAKVEYKKTVHRDTVEITVQNTPWNAGYTGFASSWTFTADGNLESVGHYE